MSAASSRDPSPPGLADVTLRDAAAGYPRRPVLRQLTARIPQSAATAIVGPNGSGKSTLLSVIAGVLPLTAGSIERRGPGRAGFVVQRTTVSDTLPLTVREAVSMGRWERRGFFRRLTRHDREVVDQSMEQLGILDLAGRQLGELSGGQRQRALVAQGLAQRAALLLLDEPTTGLDIAARQSISEALRRATEAGVTVVQATHDLEAAQLADHCLLLRDGAVAAEGRPRDVLTEAELRRAWRLPA